MELTPEIPVSPDAHGPDAQIIVPDNSSIPGSDYRVVDRRSDPDNGPLQSEEQELSDPASQEATSTSRSALLVDNDRRDFRAKAAVPPKKEQRGSVVLGILVALIIAVFGVLAGLAVAGFEIFFIPGQLSGLVLGAAPLVYARGRNAAIGTVVFFAVMHVAMILVYYPQGATDIDVQLPGGPSLLLFEPQQYDFVSPSVVDSLAQQKEGTHTQSISSKEKTSVQYVLVGAQVCVIGVFCCVLCTVYVWNIAGGSTNGSVY